MPQAQQWVFWEVDLDELDLERDADGIIGRIVERGRLVDVKWLIRTYGLPRIHRFFREAAHPEVAEKTIALWRAVFKAEAEEWARPPAWRRSSSVPWVT